MKLKPKGVVVAELDAGVYTEIAGKLRKITPKHLYIGVERELEKGKVKLFCVQPKTAKRYIAEALGKEVPKGCKFPGFKEYIHKETKKVELIKPKLKKK